MGNRRFYGGVEGESRTSATRLGSAHSGITAFAQGWDSGARIDGFVNRDGQDEFHIYTNGGSHESGKGCRGKQSQLIAIVRNGQIEIMEGRNND